MNESGTICMKKKTNENHDCLAASRLPSPSSFATRASLAMQWRAWHDVSGIASSPTRSIISNTASGLHASLSSHFRSTCCSALAFSAGEGPQILVP